MEKLDISWKSWTYHGKAGHITEKVVSKKLPVGHIFSKVGHKILKVRHKFKKVGHILNKQKINIENFLRKCPNSLKTAIYTPKKHVLVGEIFKKTENFSKIHKKT